jgi:hypothetical protein
VTQKKWQAEQRAKFSKIDAEVDAGKLAPEEALRRIREELYGN